MLYRALLQSETPALDDRLCELYFVSPMEFESQAGLAYVTGCHPNRVQATLRSSRGRLLGVKYEEGSCEEDKKGCREDER